MWRPTTCSWRTSATDILAWWRIQSVALLEPWRSASSVAEKTPVSFASSREMMSRVWLRCTTCSPISAGLKSRSPRPTKPTTAWRSWWNSGPISRAGGPIGTASPSPQTMSQSYQTDVRQIEDRIAG